MLAEAGYRVERALHPPVFCALSFGSAMGLLSRDTPPEIERRWLEGLRNLGGEKRLLQAFDLIDATRALAEARIRDRYGRDLPEREVRLRLASLWIDRETMIRVFRWDPEREGY